MCETIDFGATFERLAREQQREVTVEAGGVNVRLVHVTGGGKGQWDSHAHTTETAVVWSGDLTVEFRGHALPLSKGPCCVIPVGAEHRGTSCNGAEVVLFQQAR